MIASILGAKVFSCRIAPSISMTTCVTEQNTKVIACIFMMALATAAAWCVSYSPNRLGVAAQFLDSSLVFEAGDVARSAFISRHANFQVRGCLMQSMCPGGGRDVTQSVARLSIRSNVIVSKSTRNVLECGRPRSWWGADSDARS